MALSCKQKESTNKNCTLFIYNILFLVFKRAYYPHLNAISLFQISQCDIVTNQFLTIRSASTLL
nr:MAG TPA: hypothetical protein [Caudoviricetes sp.]